MFHSFGFIHVVVAPRSLVRPYLGPSHSFRFQLDSWTTHYARAPDSLYQAVHHPSIFLLWEYTYLYTFDSCNAPFQLVCSARRASSSSPWMSLFCYGAVFVAALLGYVYPISRSIKKWMAHLEFISCFGRTMQQTVRYRAHPSLPHLPAFDQIAIVQIELTPSSFHSHIHQNHQRQNQCILVDI
ncbi:hypothetical protein EDD17DRAFT_106569 [Pisolithus thermaeus]|nr:hypothetical protein EV401DRAFT_1106644 [Pisolithus croceorrhizus]KAI6165873.1 hypothetical protein EDD17DRAFT_106569 [Pisolithus thermaeus]